MEHLLQRVASLRAATSAAAAGLGEAAPAPIAAAGSGCASAARPALAAVVSQTLCRLGSLSVGGSNSCATSSAAASDCGSDDEEGGICAWTAEQQSAVCTLRELCALPAEASEAFLRHVLASKAGGDLQEAAAWMLECEDLAAAEAAWRQATQRRREERARVAAEREATKKQIVSRFSLQVQWCRGVVGVGWGGGGA